MHLSRCCAHQWTELDMLIDNTLRSYQNEVVKVQIESGVLKLLRNYKLYFVGGVV